MNIYPDDTLVEKRSHSQRVVSLPFERLRIRTVVVGSSKTVQDHADAADINQIVARFHRSGVLPEGKGPGQYVDVSELQTDNTGAAIVKSREVLSRVAQARAEKAAADRVKAKEQAAADAAELARLRELAAKATPPAPPSA